MQRCAQRVPHACHSLPHELGFVNPNIHKRSQVLGNKEPAMKQTISGQPAVYASELGHFVNAETGISPEPGESLGVPDATSRHNSVDIDLNASSPPFAVRLRSSLGSAAQS